MTFYASKFNGHMFSHQNWEEKYQNLKTILFLIQMFGFISVMIPHGLLLINVEMRFGFQFLKQMIQVLFNATALIIILS